MQFGLFDWVERQDCVPSETYRGRIDLARLADDAGFAGYHVAEHHGTPLSLVPSPSVLLAAIAGATTRLRLGPLVYTLPLYDPLRLIEEVCMLDQLSDGRLDSDVLSSLPDDELLAQLTAIPGIGPWTVQGALLIALRREDVVLPGDLALRKAIQAAYQLGHLPSQQEVLAIAEKWRPYRSLATSYLFSAAFEPAETR